MNELNYDQIIAIEDFVKEFKKDVKELKKNVEEFKKELLKYRERFALGIVDKQLGKAQRKFDNYADKMFKDHQKGAS